MSGPTRGGVTVKVLTGRTAASLQRYRDSLKDDQEPYLLASTRHCAHDTETQIAEWKAVREEHGTQGARRTQRAIFEKVDPTTGLHASGRRGTHVREHSGGRWRKRPVRDGEIPTHFRLAAGDLVVKESEAVHTIYAAGADLVHPENPEDIEQFFNAVLAERELHCPGLQESLWLERNGESGLVHVHVASNATIFADFTLAGSDYSAGRKMAGELTHVDSVRARFEQFLDDHPGHGFTQSLARVGTQRYRDAQLRDGQATYWAGKRGQESGQDRIRRTVGEALGAPGVTDRDSFVDEMKAHGVEVTETGLRRGVPGKGHDLAYRLIGAKQSVRGKTLGAAFTIAAIDTQLDRQARGLAIEPMAGKQHSGPPRPLPFDQVDGRSLTTDEQLELAQLRAEVRAIADDERTRRAAEQQPVPVPMTATQHAASVMQQWRDSGEADAEFERRRAELEAEEQSAVSTAARAMPTVNAAPTGPAAPPSPAVPAESKEAVPESPDPVVEPAPYRSRLRTLHGRNDKSHRLLQLLTELDETYAERFAAGEDPDQQFEQRVAQLGVGRKVLDGKLGSCLHPAILDRLERREAAKAIGTAEFELAKNSSGDEYEAHLRRSTRARELIKAGRYDQAAAMSSRPQRTALVTPDEVFTSGSRTRRAFKHEQETDSHGLG